MLISFDLETTGLKCLKHGTIQLGGLLFDPKAKVGEYLKGVELNLDFEDLVWSKFCLNLHKDWIQTNLNNKFIIPQAEAATAFIEHGFDLKEKVGVCGKNPTFDMNFFSQLPGASPLIDKYLDFRLMDPAHYYRHQSDAMQPGLAKCKQRAMEEGCTAWTDSTVAHTSLADAYDVMCLIQWAYETRKVPAC